MNAERAWQTAVIAALGGVAGLNGAYPGAPVAASEPWAELGELLVGDWSTKDAVGRELRSTILIRDRGDTPNRLHDLAAAADAAVGGIARDLGGWRIASLTLMRSRIVRDTPRGWTALIEHRVRVLAQ